jgi:hypothetical protein
MTVKRPRLEDVPWHKLRRSYGTAEGVPAAIAKLTAANEETRKEGYWSLDNGVVLQSDLYEAAPYVVPFMLDIIERRDYPGSLLAYKLLYEIANGTARDDDMSDYWVNSGPKRRMPLTQAARLAVLMGTDLYERDVQQDPRTRRVALELLDRMSEYSQEVADRLDALKASNDSDVRAAVFQIFAERD